MHIAVRHFHFVSVDQQLSDADFEVVISLLQSERCLCDVSYWYKNASVSAKKWIAVADGVSKGYSFITRDSIYAIARICHANSACLSVTHVICVEMAERIIKILSPSDRPIILVFRHQGSLRAQIWGFTPNGGAKYKGGSNLRPICSYISETIIDRGIVTMEDEYKVVCTLLDSADFDDLELPWTPISRSQYCLKANISQTVHPIHSMFGSRLWFSGSADRMALFAVR